MPSKTQTICRQAGCNSIASSNGFCNTHQGAADRQRSSNTNQAQIDIFRGGRAWKRFRSWFIAEYPLCSDPFGDHKHNAIAADQVHHVVPLSVRLDLGLEETNCRSVCTACHSRLSAMERSHNPLKAFKIWPLRPRLERAVGGSKV